MAQLICPLCGRLVALSIFDPSNFELDICTVVQTGLGRGRGFSVSDPVSVLGDKQITGLISDRCYKILGMIEGKPIPTSKEVSKHKAEISNAGPEKRTRMRWLEWKTTSDTGKTKL